MWLQPIQHTFSVSVDPRHIDEYGHVNNVHYIEWAIECAWSHSRELGFGFEDFENLGVGFVVVKHEYEYMGQAKEGDEVIVATAIIENDARLKIKRYFEMRQSTSEQLLVKGYTTFACMNLKSGKAARMPDSFVSAYSPI